MIIVIPLAQVFLFTYSINNDPKNIPTVIVAADESSFTRKLINELQLSSYFDVLGAHYSSSEADNLLKNGGAQFAIYIPPGFTRDLIRGERPQLLIEADATDPASVSYAFSALSEISQLYFKDFAGTLAYLRNPAAKIDIAFHPKYNPERITEYNIVPGLLAVVLTITLVLVTALSVVRENENGTMEVCLFY